MTVYINENFDGVTVPALPSGWSSTGAAGATVVSESAVSYSGSQAVAFSGLTGSYAYAWKQSATDTNFGNTWVEAKFLNPAVATKFSGYVYLYARCQGAPSGATNPTNCFGFYGNFDNEQSWGLFYTNSSGVETSLTTLNINVVFASNSWYRWIINVSDAADGTYHRVSAYVQRMSDGAWLRPDATWVVGVQTAVMAWTNSTTPAYVTGWSTGSFAVFGVYLTAGDILYMDDALYQDVPAPTGNTPTSPPNPGGEVELIPSASTSVDAGIASHGTAQVNQAGFGSSYISTSQIGGAWFQIDAGSGVTATPTACLWAPALYNYSGLGVEQMMLGASIEGSNNQAAWTQLGTWATNSYPEPNGMNTLRLDPTNPGGTYRYFRIRAPQDLCCLSQFRMHVQNSGGVSWKPARPVLTPAGGQLAAGGTVSIQSYTSGASIYYTTDGTTPALSGGVPQGTTTLYSGPVTVPTNTPANSFVKALTYHASGTTTTSDVVTGTYMVGKTFVPDTGNTGNTIFGSGGSTVQWPQNWVDNRGVLIQALAGGHCSYDAASGQYLLFGSTLNGGVGDGTGNVRGFVAYTSTDLYNWTYQGTLLMPPPVTWRLNSGGNNYVTRAHLLINPNPLNANKKYVIWCHIGTPGTQACATSANLLGPYTWTNVYYQPNGAQAGDTNVFYDVVDDGTGNSRKKAYLVWLETGTGIVACQLDPATDWTSPTGSNTTLAATAPREAPVLFFNPADSYYYLLTSNSVAYGAGNAGLDYRSATTLAGLAAATDGRIWTSAPTSAQSSYNVQCTCVFQVNGLSAPGFILMTENQDAGESPINMYHARMAWYHVNSLTDFAGAGQLSMAAPTSWNISALPAPIAGANQELLEIGVG